jgi:hypothetical protein
VSPMDDAPESQSPADVLSCGPSVEAAHDGAVTRRNGEQSRNFPVLPSLARRPGAETGVLPDEVLSRDRKAGTRPIPAASKCAESVGARRRRLNFQHEHVRPFRRLSVN